MIASSGSRFRITMVLLACLGAAGGAGAQSLDAFDPLADGAVYSIVVQPDQRILVAGAFTALDEEVSVAAVRDKVARLNADGSLDTSFNPAAGIGAQAQVRAMVLQPDGKVVVAGIGFENGRNIVRLNADGSLDPGFTTAADDDVYALALQADGRIVVGGSFSTLSDQSAGSFDRAGIGRLNANGSVDASFDPGTNGVVNGLLVQQDGRILVGGRFTTLGGGGIGATARSNIGRLETSGAIDATFDPGAGGHPSARVTSFAIQPDGMILVGGRFTTFGGGGTGQTTRNNLARLAPGGALDATFVPETFAPDDCSECVISIVETILVLPSRRILIGGLEVVADGSREDVVEIARLHPNGDFDSLFHVPVDEAVHAIVPQRDGRILLGGEFFWNDSLVFQSYMARIHPDTPEFEELFAPDSEPGSSQGYSVAISDDGNTAIVGGPDDTELGGAWIWIRTARPAEGGGVEIAWERQGPKLVGTSIVGEEDFIGQGFSVAISADGNTAIVGGPGDNDDFGAAWIWVRSGGVWSQEAKLIGTGAAGSQPLQGMSVAISGDGDTAIVGGTGDDDGLGAAWVFTRTGTAWTQQGNKLVADDASGSLVRQGSSVALSGDGSTAIIGGNADDDGVGAAWAWTRSGSEWTQQGAKLVGSGGTLNGNQGISVSLSADGNTALVGAAMDLDLSGSAWVWVRTAGVWSQQGAPLAGVGAVGPYFEDSVHVALSADGNTAVVGWSGDFFFSGALWAWTRQGSVWTPRGGKIVNGQAFDFGLSVDVSADGKTIISGCGCAAWVYALPTAVTQAATAVTGSSATLNAAINPNANAVYATFEYGLTDTYGRTVWANPAVSPGSTLTPASVAVTGLSCGTSYHFRAIAGGSTTTYGDDVTFATLACPPVVTTLPVQTVNKGPTSAIMDALVNPNGADTTLFFDYGLTPQYGGLVTYGSVGAGMTTVTGSSFVGGLSCATTYYYRARAQHVGGSSSGDGLSFTTSACAPTITSVTSGNTQLTVAFTPGADGGAPISHYEYSLDGGLTWVTPSPAVTTSPLVLTGLTNGTPYQVQLRAVNANYFGAASAPGSGTPSTTPGAPTITGITPGNAQLQIAFAAGGNGGAAITNYQYSLDGGGTWLTRSPAAATSPLDVTGLTNGVTYQVRLRAVNVNGPGDPSPIAEATPALAADEAADVFNPGANGDVTTVVVQADGKILVGGQFTRLGGGGTGSVPRNNIGRLNADGSVDMGFDPGRDLENPEQNRITAIAVQQDGKIVIAWDGPDPLQIRRRVGRLNPDGSIDENFRSTANGPVLALALQSDGKVLAGGSFTELGSWTDDGLLERVRYGIGRLNQDGTLDMTFDPGTAGTVVRALAPQSDGRILVGGSFALLGPGGGVPRHNIGRLNADGSVDLSFDPGAGGGPQPTVKSLSVDGSGIFVGGRFATLGGGGTGTTARRNIGRLQLSGTLDSSFVPGSGAASSSETLPIVESLLPLPNGQVLLGGYAVAVTGTGAIRHLARLNANGALDTGFDPDADGRVNTLAMQHDGKILIGGAFTSVGGQTRHRLARLGAAVPGRFTDDPLIPGVTTLKAVHIYELRAHITELRRRFNLAEVAWTNPTLVGVLVRAAHIQQLRQALLEAFDAALARGLNVTRPIFADDPLTTPGVAVRALHIEQLRSAVRSLESP